MQLFVLTPHCNSRVHCQTCRNKEGGRSWRANMANYYVMPEAPSNSNKSDFECPFGVPWLNENVENTTVTISQKTNSELKSQNQQPSKRVNQPIRNSDSRNSKPGGCGCGRQK